MGQRKRRMFGPGQLGRITLALGAAALIAGCGAGQITQTNTQRPAVNGDEAVAGMLRISNAAMSYPEGEAARYPAGSDVALVLTIANNGAEDDQLQSASSPQAESVSITGDKQLIAFRRLNVGHAAGTEPADVEATQDGEEIGSAQIVLKGITSELRPGMTVQVTLTFRDAGTVTLRLPIEAPTHVRTAEPEAEQGAEGGHG